MTEISDYYDESYAVAELQHKIVGEHICMVFRSKEEGKYVSVDICPQNKPWFGINVYDTEKMREILAQLQNEDWNLIRCDDPELRG